MVEWVKVELSVKKNHFVVTRGGGDTLWDLLETSNISSMPREEW
jgi:hypothetical protein